MKLRVVRPFRWAGEHVEPGTLLDVADVREAHRLVYGYQDCVFVDEGVELPRGMVVGNADPVVETRDPVMQPNAGPRRRRS